MTIIGAGQATTTGDSIMRSASPRFLPPLAPLAGYVSLLLAPAITAHAGNPPASASAANTTGMTIAVSNCNDHGTGSLRNAVARALSGDTVDMRGLTCRRINLTSGAIAIPQDDLTLVGGGRITVDANHLSSVFRHNGTGWFRIRGMTIARGSRLTNHLAALGGCIFSSGNIELRHTLVRRCRAVKAERPARGGGGGIFARGAVTLIDSKVLDNAANHTGGVYAEGRLTAYRSHICGNSGGAITVFGGLDVNYTTFSNNGGNESENTTITAYRNIRIANSTISGNQAKYVNVRLDPNDATGNVMIVNSTISGNTSGDHTAVIERGSKSIINSTIAFNRHAGDCDEDGLLAVIGTVLFSGGGAGGDPLDEPAHIESTIIANNVCYGNPYLDVAAWSVRDPAFVGANNLITSSNKPLPPDTIDADPRLAPLASNGGRTKTHALLNDSPAIDTGNNAAGLAYDQRGPGFPRVKGLQADIGTYER